MYADSLCMIDSDWHIFVLQTEIEGIAEACDILAGSCKNNGVKLTTTVGKSVSILVYWIIDIHNE